MKALLHETTEAVVPLPATAGEAANEPQVINDAGEFFIADDEIDLRRYRLEDWLALGFFWLLGLIVFYQFFTRYALNDSAAWTEEIARYVLIGMVFIGAATCVRKNNHI